MSSTPAAGRQCRFQRLGHWCAQPVTLLTPSKRPICTSNTLALLVETCACARTHPVVHCCPAAGFNAVGSLTSLTALHVIRHGQFDARPPATTLTALSRLARLRALRCDAGGRASLPAYYVSHSEQAASGDASAQAKCWGTVLPCMPYLTRLELLEVAVGDALLCAVGSNAPQLQRLVL